MSISNERDTFVQQIDAVSDRMDQLYQTVHNSPSQPPNLVMECLQELCVALEELHIAEEELRQQNETLIEARYQEELERQRYQELFEFAPDGYVVTDIYGKILEANSIAAKLLNLSQHYLMGKPLINFVPDEYRRTFRSILNQLPRIQRVQEWEIKLWKRGDYPIQQEQFDAALTVETVRNGTGTVVALRWLLRDISARKQAEAQLRQTQLQNLHLVEADRLKTQFIATLSHELRTPMTAILGFSNLLQQQLHQRQENHMTDMVERIFRNGKHLLGLIEEMLDFSKLRSNQLELRLESFDLMVLVTETTEEMRALAEQKALEFHVELTESYLIVTHDRLRLRQILVNLLSNAIKFTESGRVMVEVKTLPSDRILLQVRDTGIGIHPEEQKHIFKEFWQADQSTSRQYGGTGLGLAITHNLVKVMQGTITVDSHPGYGTTFRVELPYHLS
ncbi:MAG TPA: ATP-binding protein [Allocoleopsis sp.]